MTSRVGTYADMDMIIALYVDEIAVSRIDMMASLCSQYAKKYELPKHLFKKTSK